MVIPMLTSRNNNVCLIMVAYKFYLLVPVNSNSRDYCTFNASLTETCRYCLEPFSVGFLEEGDLWA
jgi:hypothetical protein